MQFIVFHELSEHVCGMFFCCSLYMAQFGCELNGDGLGAWGILEYRSSTNAIKEMASTCNQWNWDPYSRVKIEKNCPEWMQMDISAMIWIILNMFKENSKVMATILVHSIFLYVYCIQKPREILISTYFQRK